MEVKIEEEKEKGGLHVSNRGDAQRKNEHVFQAPEPRKSLLGTLFSVILQRYLYVM